MVEFRILEGDSWCECMVLSNGHNIGDARYQLDYDDKGNAIFHFEILKEYRRKGYGSILLNQMLSMIKEKNIRILIGEGYDENIFKFLKINGFSSIKESSDYFCMEALKIV